MMTTNTTRPISRFPLLLLLLAFFWATLAFAPAVFAQETTPLIPDDEVNAIAKEMFCPVCENVPLDVCPTQACAQWRELIRQRLAEGWSEQEIKDYFVQQYGDRVLAEPPRTGLNWLVYIIPPVIVLAGVVIVVRVLQSWKLQTAQMNSARPPTIDDDYVRRLEEELKRRD
jgi:cytochrome c-type biogenesis protein CcmH